MCVVQGLVRKGPVWCLYRIKLSRAGEKTCDDLAVVSG